MIYKFNSGLPELDSTSIELEVDVDQLILRSKIHDDDLPHVCQEQDHYIDYNDIDDLISALSDLKKLIQERKRKMNK